MADGGHIGPHWTDIGPNICPFTNSAPLPTLPLCGHKDIANRSSGRARDRFSAESCLGTALETLTAPVSRLRYTSCLASPSERVTKAQIKPSHALSIPLWRALCASAKTLANRGRAARNFQQNRDLSGKHSQLLSRGSDTLAVLPALRSGSRRPRSSPATPSASPCGARGSNTHRVSWGSRGPAPLQSRNFQNLTEQSGEIVSLSRGARGFAPRKMGDTGGVFPL